MVNVLEFMQQNIVPSNQSHAKNLKPTVPQDKHGKLQIGEPDVSMGLIAQQLGSWGLIGGFKHTNIDYKSAFLVL